jgi:acyl-coenzyme A synthetase/AMP-(fatty) acid ligase
LWSRAGIQPLQAPTRRAPACLIKLTSGSTGLPRPLFFDDAQMLADGRQVTATMGIRSADTNLALIPFGHSYGLGNLVMPLIQLGTPVAVCREPFPHSIAKVIAASGATVVPAVPAILNALARAGIDPRAVRGVRLWISAGSPLAAEDARQFNAVFGARIHNFYGSSETGGIAYDRCGEETLSGRSVGTPLSGVTAHVSSSGRLRVSSGAVYTRGNPRREGGTGAHMLADLASVLDDGSIVLHGRRTRLVKIAGKRVSLTEIERQLLRVEGLRGARVVEVATGGRTRLAAAVWPVLPKEGLKNALRAHYPPWKIPDKWLILPAFPMTGRGKVNFKELDARLRA